MKLYRKSVAVFAALILLCTPCHADTVTLQKTTSWYCTHTTGGKQPSLPAEFPFLETHGGFFIDHEHKTMDDERVIYLTFDAGYENGNIEKILDVLKEEQVTGAFFILANLAHQNPELVKRMAAEGHLVCNHTASHKDMSRVTDSEMFKAELEKMEQICLEETGVTMAKYYRPPEGRFTEQNLADAETLGYKTILWSFAYADWDNKHQMNADAAIKKLTSGLHNGEVLLLHPTSETNAAILGGLIRTWKEQGFRFGTLDELTGRS